MEQPPFKQYAQAHIKTAEQIYGVHLGYDEQSILMLDELIQKTWPDKPPVELENILGLFGSFLGEAIINTLGGEWVNTESGWGVKIGDAKLMVFTKIQRRLVNGMEDSISFYYQKVKEMLKTAFPS